MNPATYSSFLFLIPAALSIVLLPLPDVTIACLICMTTSIINHAHRSEDPWLRRVDQITVRLVAGAYIIHTAISMGASLAALPIYVLALATVAMYVHLHSRPHLYEGRHYQVHVLAVAGVTAYVLARAHRLVSA